MKLRTRQKFHSLGALRHIRRNVLLLLGSHPHLLRSGISRYAREAQWILDDTFSATAGMVPTWWRGDGMLTLITSRKDAVARSHFPGVPLVDFSKGWISEAMPAQFRAAGKVVPRVLYNNEMIGRLGAEHFVERGFKHIAIFNSGNYWMERERIPHFQKAVEAAGAEFIEIKYYTSQPPGEQRAHVSLRDHPSMHKWLVKCLRNLPKPVGIALASDGNAWRVMRACEDAKLCVPDEVAILGCHNDPSICDFTPVTLSSIDDDLERVGYEGAKLLDQIMAGKRAPRAPILISPKGVVARMSTNILAVDDPNVARAFQFIEEHHHQAELTVRDVATAAGLSRCILDRTFQKYLGRSPARQILAVRIEHAKRLLLESNLKAHEVADRTGFSGIVHFSQAFHRTTGLRPRDFRAGKRL